MLKKTLKYTFLFILFPLVYCKYYIFYFGFYIKFRFILVFCRKTIIFQQGFFFSCFVVTPLCGLLEWLSKHYHDCLYYLILMILSLVGSKVHLHFGLVKSSEKCSKTVTRKQSPFKFIVPLRCVLHLIFFWWSFETLFSRLLQLIFCPIWPSRFM